MAKIKNFVDKVKYGIGISLAGANEAVFTGNGENIVVVARKEQGGELAEALIKGEVTQEVMDLRYRTYLIEEESNKKEVIGVGEDDMVSFAIPSIKNKPKIEENEEEYKTILVQNMDPVSTGIVDNLTDNGEAVEKMDYFYPLTVERDFISRFPIEKNCHQLVVKQHNEKEDIFQLELYFTVYADTIDRIKRMFTNEVEKLYNKTIRSSDVNDIQTIEFITKSAWGDDNNKKYKFEILSYKECSKFNGYYILKFITKPLIYGEKTIDKFYSKNMRDKYDNREARPNKDRVAKPIFGPVEETIEHCDKCGKEMKGLEINDYRITKQDYGVGLCQSCLLERIKNNNI